MQETWVWSLGWEDPPEKGMATRCSILAWRLPWAEETGRLQSPGFQRVGHDRATKHRTAQLSIKSTAPRCSPGCISGCISAFMLDHHPHRLTLTHSTFSLSSSSMQSHCILFRARSNINAVFLHHRSLKWSLLFGKLLSLEFVCSVFLLPFVSCVQDHMSQGPRPCLLTYVPPFTAWLASLHMTLFLWEIPGTCSQRWADVFLIDRKAGWLPCPRIRWAFRLMSFSSANASDRLTFRIRVVYSRFWKGHEGKCETYLGEGIWLDLEMRGGTHLGPSVACLRGWGYRQWE